MMVMRMMFLKILLGINKYFKPYFPNKVMIGIMKVSTWLKEQKCFEKQENEKPFSGSMFSFF